MRLDHLLSMENVSLVERYRLVFDRRDFKEKLLFNFQGPNADKSVILTQRVHPYPFRTRKLSSAVPRVLRRKQRGRVGHGRHRIPDASTQYGGVAQLGEHLPCKQGVMGSNPIISTIGDIGTAAPRPNPIISTKWS